MDTEIANSQDARVDALWATLDTRKQGQLDLAGLKKGLRKLDHRMGYCYKRDNSTKPPSQH